MSEFTLEDLMRDCYKRGNLDYMLAAIREKAFTGSSEFFNSQNGMRQYVNSIDNNKLFRLVVEQYVSQLISGFRSQEHKGKKNALYIDGNGSKKELLQPYSDLDKAIIMTHEKYINGSNGYSPLELSTHCIEDLFYNNNNHFTRSVDNRNISARNYVDQYVNQMSHVTKDWKMAAYSQMIQDVCLSFSKQFERERNEEKEINENQIKVKRFFPGIFKKAKAKMASGKINGVARRQTGKLPGMYYAQDIGNVRENQEDAVLIMEHPTIKGLRIAIVSDGMGGGQYGEEASHKVITELKKWFEEIEIDPNKVDTSTLRMSMAEKIKEISAKVIAEFGNNCGATLTGAIIGNKDAVVVNVGDSRTYLVKDGNLRQVTVDHSDAQKMYEKRFKYMYPGMTPDEMRFWAYSNVINKCIGSDVAKSVPDFFHLNKEDFDRLILCSDGVSDCLSYKQISTFAKMYSGEKLATGLVNGALTNDSHPDRQYGIGFKDTIKGGKDNTTVAVVEDKGR